MAVANGEINRVIVAMPPGHGKSTMTSHYFPTWFLGRFPTQKLLVCSYEGHFAANWGRHCRDTLAEYGSDIYGVSVNPNSQRSDWWETTQGGIMYSSGVGGAITGKRLNGIVIDDPFKSNEDANSETQRQKKWDWFCSTAYTRLEPGGFVIIVMTRWHEEDIAGRCITEMEKGTGDKYTVINLPALALDDDDDPLGRKPGEALWPTRFSADDLARTQRVVGSYWWQAMYQGDPQTPGGEVFKREWFKYYQHSDKEEHLSFTFENDRTIEIDSRAGIRYMTVDLAASLKDEANFTVLMVWVRLLHLGKPIYALLDVVRARMDGPTILANLKSTCKKWKCRVVGIESVGFQLALCQIAQKQGLPVREMLPDKDKLSRALAATPAFERGEVWFPGNAPWLATLEHEMLGFPHGAKDDQVDAISMGVAFPPLPSAIPPKPRKGTKRQRKADTLLDAKAPRDDEPSIFEDDE